MNRVVESYSEKGILDNHHSCVNDLLLIALSSESTSEKVKYLVSSSNDRSLRVYNIDELKNSFEFHHECGLDELFFYEKHQKVLCASCDGHLLVFDVKVGDKFSLKLIQRLKLGTKNEQFFGSLALNPQNDNQIFICSENRQLGGIYILNYHSSSQKFESDLFFHNEESKDAIRVMSISQIFHPNIIYFGGGDTTSRGKNDFSLKKMDISTRRITKNLLEGKSKGVIYSLLSHLQDSCEFLFVGNLQREVFVLKNEYLMKTIQIASEYGSIYTISRFSPQILLIGTNSGLFVMNTKNDYAIVQLTDEEKKKNKFRSSGVTKILFDGLSNPNIFASFEDGTISICTINPEYDRNGFNYFDPRETVKELEKLKFENRKLKENLEYQKYQNQAKTKKMKDLKDDLRKKELVIDTLKRDLVERSGEIIRLVKYIYGKEGKSCSTFFESERVKFLEKGYGSDFSVRTKSIVVSSFRSFFVT